MQSPAKPYGCRGRVTATKHIGLDSFRVRNCDPGADDRLPIDRASRCWNDDRGIGCYWQPTGLCAPSRLFVEIHDSVRRPPSVDGVEPRMRFAFRTVAARLQNRPGSHGSARHRLPDRLFSLAYTGSGLTDVRRATSSFGWVCASGRSAPSSVLLRPFLSRSHPLAASHPDDAGQSGCELSARFVVAATGSQNGLRTHSLIRVSDEKRNADECPPARGKSDRHR
jgi:hypothetical protein